MHSQLLGAWAIAQIDFEVSGLRFGCGAEARGSRVASSEAACGCSEARLSDPSARLEAHRAPSSAPRSRRWPAWSPFFGPPFRSFSLSLSLSLFRSFSFTKPSRERLLRREKERRKRRAVQRYYGGRADLSLIHLPLGFFLVVDYGYQPTRPAPDDSWGTPYFEQVRRYATLHTVAVEGTGGVVVRAARCRRRGDCRHLPPVCLEMQPVCLGGGGAESAVMPRVIRRRGLISAASFVAAGSGAEAGGPSRAGLSLRLEILAFHLIIHSCFLFLFWRRAAVGVLTLCYYSVE